jgi:uncharacterized protein (TIGR02145 family)
VGQVSHFSFWNCDVPMDYIQLTGVVQTGGAALSGAVVTVTSTSMGSATDYTGPTGNFGGYVPAGEPLTLTVSLGCAGGSYQVVHTQQLGVLTANTNVGTIAVSSPNTTVVSGSIVDCDGQPLAQGYVLANGEAVFANGGQFSFSTCAGGSITLTGIDPVGGASSVAVTVSLVGSVVDAGQLEACAQSGGSEGHLNPDVDYGSIVDVQGNAYATVIIGDQEWMAENLRTTGYQNGEQINIPNNSSEFYSATTGLVMNTLNSPDWNAPRGKFYNWYAITDPRKVCPFGWHIPTDVEWQTLETELGMPNFELNSNGPTMRGESTNVGGKIKSEGFQFWGSPNEGATNVVGFSALPSGAANFPGENTYSGWFWSSTEGASSDAWVRLMTRNSGGIRRSLEYKGGGFSVRCIRD